MKEFEGLPPEKLNEVLDVHLQDFDRRKQDWQARRDALREQTQAVNAEVDGVLARRSPGSALKPFIYALAMQQGLIHPHTLLRDGRIMRLHFDIPDRPGVLADIAARISDLGGNVIEVKHQQLFGAPTVQSTELHLMVEVRDQAQGDAIIAAMEAADYVVRRG